MRSEFLSGEKPGNAHLPSLPPTLLHFKVSLHTLRSPTLHLRWRIKEMHYALKKLIPKDGCQAVTILPWPCESVFPFSSLLRKRSEAIRSALYESIIFIPSVDTVFGCHVLQKGKAVCGNISGGSSDLPQFVFIYKLFSQNEKHSVSSKPCIQSDGAE